MPDVSVLEVLLYGEAIGTLTRVQGDRNIFAFNQAYVDNANRPTLSLSVKDALGGLITELAPTHRRACRRSSPTCFPKRRCANTSPSGPT